MPSPATTHGPVDVLPMKEARKSLPEASRRNRELGAEAEPIFFGAHRNPDSVLLSYDRYVKLLDMIDDMAAALEIRRRDRVDEGNRMTLEELVLSQGFELSEFGLADES